MKKFRHFIPFLLAAVLALAIPLAACDSCKKEEKKTLQSIEVVEAEAGFELGEEFSSDGLVVKATYTKDSSEEAVEEILDDDDYQVDSSAYNKDALGFYNILVSYTYRGETKETSYEVEVVGYKQDGIDVALAEGVDDTYYLSKANPTVEIDISKIVVRNVNKNGSLGTTITDYTAKLFKGQEEIIVTNGKATVSSGAYAIWVEKESERNPGFIRSGFAVIYVNDDIDNVVVKEGVGTYTQPVGVDLISDTWVFTVSYVSGASKDIKVADCSISINTLVEGSKTANATYNDYNAKGEKISKSFEVPYTIISFNGTKVENKFNYAAITGVSEDNFVLNQSHFTGDNSFLKVGSGTVTYRTSPQLIQIENEGLQITIQGTGLITVGVSSTNGTNTSRFGLKGEDGKYLPASYTANANIELDDTEDDDGNVAENVYLVTGSSALVFKYTISKPGTYTLVSTRDAAYNRGSRIHSISVEDYVPATGAALSSVDYSNQTYITYKKVEKV